MNEIKYEIIKTIGVLSTSASGWRKELNLISDEYNKFELEGSLLADNTKPLDAVLGQFGRIVQL